MAAKHGDFTNTNMQASDFDTNVDGTCKDLYLGQDCHILFYIFRSFNRGFTKSGWLPKWMTKGTNLEFTAYQHIIVIYLLLTNI